jgi:hypothetical protein
MDAVKFVEERRRMYTLGCIKKGINDYNTKAEDVVAEVEQWSTAHPHKTRQSVFLEHYPDAPRDKNNLLTACPKCLDANVSCVIDKNATVKKLKRCDACRREFWMQEVE